MLRFRTQNPKYVKSKYLLTKLSNNIDISVIFQVEFYARNIWNNSRNNKRDSKKLNFLLSIINNANDRQPYNITVQLLTRNTNLVSLVYLVTVVNLYISRSNFLLTHEMLSKTRWLSTVKLLYHSLTMINVIEDVVSINKKSTINYATKFSSIDQTVKYWLLKYLRIMSLFFK